MALILGLFLLGCGDGGVETMERAAIEDVGPSTASTTAPLPARSISPAAPPTTATPSAGRASYCRHLPDIEGLVEAIDRGDFANEDRAANLRVFEVEALMSADVDALRGEGNDLDAAKVADHATALRTWFQGWVGRGPNPGHDIRQDYVQASHPARSMCP